MAFGQDFLKAFFGNDYVRDYAHASKIFRTDGYSNSPRLKFLFHVYFNINTDQIPQLRNVFSTPEKSTIGLLVKNIDLPQYKIDVETLNQYNRKRIVQKKIEYQPISVKFHDDGGDLIRLMWYNYFSYYFKDPNQPYRNSAATNGSIGQSATLSNGSNINDRDIYANERLVNDWGFIGEAYASPTNSSGGKPPFFRDISIYGFNQHQFCEYVLINPVISDWRHDNYDYYQDAGVMENSMTINYETVKYYSGAIGDVSLNNNGPVQGFGTQQYYDRVKSPLTREGGTRSVLGQGGLIDAGLGIIQDLQSGTVGGVVGAVQKAGTVYNTFRGANLRAIVNQTATDAVIGELRNIQQGVPGSTSTSGIRSVLNRPLFPTPPRGSSVGAVQPPTDAGG